MAAGQNTPSLAATAVNLNGATIKDGAGNAANLSLTGLTQTGPQIDTTTPTIIVDLVKSPSSGDLNAGKTVTLTLNLSEAVTVAGRHADADAQRRRHGDLYRRVRHQCADLQLHGRRPGRTLLVLRRPRSISIRRPSRTVPATLPVCR